MANLPKTVKMYEEKTIELVDLPLGFLRFSLFQSFRSTKSKWFIFPFVQLMFYYFMSILFFPF